MAAHVVTFKTPELALGNADIEFKIKRDKSVLGHLKISRGNVVWVPKDKTYGKKLDWASFAKLFDEQGVDEKHPG